MSFDTIFDEPELTHDDPDEYADAVATTYRATATRTGSVWAVTVQDLPDSHAAHAQGVTWAEAEANAHAAAVEVLKPEDPVLVLVHLLPADPDAADAIQDLTDARIARAEAEQAERLATTKAARLLTAKGWTTRDAGRALRLSHQRISQLAPRADS